MRIIISILALSILLGSCQGVNCIDGSGNQVSESRDLGQFSQIETSGSMKVILKQNDSNMLIITADDNIIEEIETFVSGKKLIIDMDANFCNPGPVTVYVNSREYSEVEASGAVEILSDGKLKVNDFELDLSGSSKVNLDIDAANIKTSSSGSSEILLKGQAGSHELDLSGSSSIDALDFVVGKYDISSSGASRSRINVLSELNINSSGSSDVQYRGNPSNVKNSQSGSSSLTRLD